MLTGNRIMQPFQRYAKRCQPTAPLVIHLRGRIEIRQKSFMNTGIVKPVKTRKRVVYTMIVEIKSGSRIVSPKTGEFSELCLRCATEIGDAKALHRIFIAGYDQPVGTILEGIARDKGEESCLIKFHKFKIVIGT